MIGFLLIDKPDGMTSHDVVARVRRLTGEKRVGHAGTLDPFATGLLVVGVGRVATREFPKLVGLGKEYEAEFLLGATSDTDDRTGTITPRIQSHFSGVPAGEPSGIPSVDDGNHVLLDGDGTKVPLNSIRSAIAELTGPISQIPPNYSAIKIGGKKMYEAAREGKPMVAKAREVTVYGFEIVDAARRPPLSPPPYEEGELVRDGRLHVRIACSTGTYIRSLARDLGAKLGVGGYVQELRRTSVGPFRIEEAIPLKTLTPETVEAALLPVESVLSRVGASATVSG